MKGNWLLSFGIFGPLCGLKFSVTAETKTFDRRSSSSIGTSFDYDACVSSLEAAVIDNGGDSFMDQESYLIFLQIYGPEGFFHDVTVFEELPSALKTNFYDLACQQNDPGADDDYVENCEGTAAAVIDTTGVLPGDELSGDEKSNLFLVCYKTSISIDRVLTSLSPSFSPSVSIVSFRTIQPTDTPFPTASFYPSSAPSTSSYPSSSPTISVYPSSSPSISLYPSETPSAGPTESAYPSHAPTALPTESSYPSSTPSAHPTASSYPSAAPSKPPTNIVTGGINNTVNGDFGTISGGFSNFIDGDYGAISGGISNGCADKAVVGGGMENVANATKSTIFGGTENLIAPSSDEAIIGGGLGNSIASEKSSIAGGRENAIDAVVGSVVLGGKNNQIDGENNRIRSGDLPKHSVASGGSANNASDDASVVVGGKLNEALGKYSVVAGGKANVVTKKATASGGRKNFSYSKSVSSGGLSNVAFASSAVGGGDQNYALSRHGVIAGGRLNGIYAASSFGSITGGKNHQLSFGEYGIILSGESNTLQQPRGIAAGKNATVTKQRSAVFSLTPSARDSRSSEFVVACQAFTLKIDGCPDLTIDASNLNLLRSVIASTPASGNSLGIRSRSLAGDNDHVLEELEAQIVSQATVIQELLSILNSLEHKDFVDS